MAGNSTSQVCTDTQGTRRQESSVQNENEKGDNEDKARNHNGADGPSDREKHQGSGSSSNET